MTLGVNSKSIHCHQTEKIFTVCVDLVFGSKCVQFREICLLQCNTFWVDPHALRITEKGSSETQEFKKKIYSSMGRDGGIFGKGTLLGILACICF